jgi:PRTRC genetic system protein B
MTIIKPVNQYEPSTVIVNYYSKSDHEYYSESAVLHKKGNSYVPGAFKPLSVNFLSRLVENIKSKDYALSFKGLIPGNVLWFGLSNGAIKVLWHVAPKKAYLHFSKEMQLKNGRYNLPGIAFLVEGDELNVFAIKDRQPALDTLLFNAPFGNVSNEGKVCMGNVAVKESFDCIEDLIDSWENYFFNSVFTHTNNDRIVKGNLVKILKSVRENDNPFPDKVLLLEGRTIKDLIT